VGTRVDTIDAVLHALTSDAQMAIALVVAKTPATR